MSQAGRPQASGSAVGKVPTPSSGSSRSKKQDSDSDDEALLRGDTPRRSRKTTVKVNTPDEFYGERRKLKSFILQCDLYLRFNEHLYPEEEDQILFLITYLRGDAQNWIQPFVEDYLRNTPATREQITTEMFQTY